MRVCRSVLLVSLVFTLSCGDDDSSMDAAVPTDAGRDVTAPQDGGNDGSSDVGPLPDTPLGDPGTFDATDAMAVDASDGGPPPDTFDGGPMALPCDGLPADAVCAGFESDDEEFPLRPDRGLVARPGEGLMGSTAACADLTTDGSPASGPMSFHSFEPPVVADVVYMRSHFRFGSVDGFSMADLRGVRISFLGRVDVPSSDTLAVFSGGRPNFNADRNAGGLFLVMGEPGDVTAGQWVCIQRRIETREGGRVQMWIDGRLVADEEGYPGAPDGYGSLSYGAFGAYEPGADGEVCMDELAFSTVEMPPCLL